LPRNFKMMGEKKHHRGAPAEQVEAMFDSISPHYDRLNHLLSLGTDRLWRRRAVNLIGKHVKPGRIIDVATGTGDLAIAAMRLEPEEVTGIDISGEMLARAREKITRLGYGEKIGMLQGDSAYLDFRDGTFDVAMSAFGVRNFEDTVTGLREMCRVLKPGGMVMILEFSKPSWFPLKQIYSLYFRKILPRIGRRISGDPYAYTYLPETVSSFPENEAFLDLLTEAGFRDVNQKRMTGGIASVYYGFRT
jgi:demethylmenaquinone methyltransferase/2-methoxy-6-polyprenyl-1,4-benzoquinol methylase